MQDRVIVVINVTKNELSVTGTTLTVAAVRPYRWYHALFDALLPKLKRTRPLPVVPSAISIGVMMQPEEFALLRDAVNGQVVQAVELDFVTVPHTAELTAEEASV